MNIATVPTATTASLGTSRQNARTNDEKRKAKFYIDVFCGGKSPIAKSLNGKRVVLRNNKIYIDHSQPSLRKQPSLTAEAFYMAYPDESQARGDGLATSVSDSDPSALNWIYVDSRTLELKYGNRSQSIEHIVGHWDWDTEGNVGITLEGEELFSALEEKDGSWALYFDRNGDGLKGHVEPGMKVIEISLDRRSVSG